MRSLLALVPVPVLVLVFLFLPLGCSPKQVVFSRDGVPHCPHCLVAVEPFSNLCPREECGRSYRWAASPVVCPHCAGVKVCPECEGTGKVYRVQESPPEVAGGAATFRVARPGPDCSFCSGKGQCPTCDANGFVTHGQPAMGRSE